MADDDKVVKEGQLPADPPAVKPSAQTFEQAATPRQLSPDPGSEWTASDSRGPLSTAEMEAAERAQDRVSEPASPPKAEEAVVSKPATFNAEPEPTTEPAPGIAEDREKPASEPLRPPHIVHEVKRPILPIAAGIVIGAAIGAGSAAFVYRSVQNDVVSDEVVRLASRVDTLEKRPDAQASVVGLKQNVADLEGRLAGMSKAGDAPAVDLGPLQTRMAALQSGLDSLKARAGDTKTLDAKVASLESAVSGMKSQASSAQAGVAEVQGQQKQLAGKVMVPALAVVADSLVQQIGQGQPYAAQVDALAALSADPTKIAVLRQNATAGVPSAKVLAAKFEPLAEPLVNVAHHAPPNAGFVERLKSGMMSLVSVRRADDLSGSDPASRVAHIRSDLAHDDVAAALVVWDGLPADAKAKGEAWRALAKTHADAMTAARGLQHDAITALGSKKS